MCDTTLTLGENDSYHFECPSRWSHHNLPKEINDLFEESLVANTYHMALGINGSFVFSYRSKAGEVRLASKDVPDNLHTWLYAKDADGDCIRTFEKLYVSFGPDGKSFWATDGEDYIWAFLPAELNSALKGLIEDGRFIDSPRLVSLGVGGDFTILTEQNACHWHLTNYEELNSAVAQLKANEALHTIRNIALSPYKADTFALVCSHSPSFFVEGMPASVAAEMQAMAAAIQSDTEKQKDLEIQESNRQMMLLQEEEPMTDMQALNDLDTSGFTANVGYECAFCALNPAYCTCTVHTDWRAF